MGQNERSQSDRRRIQLIAGMSTVNQFRFTPIADFDARRGYKRCPLPGVDISSPGQPPASADFWRDRNKRIVTRFSSQGHQFSCEIVNANGANVIDPELDVLAATVGDLLLSWLIEGVDEAPTI